MTLLSVQWQGFGWCIMLFLLVVVAVHLAKLIAVGYRTLFRKLPPEPPKIAEKKPEPVYYIVERKKRRPKKEYAEPKEISFR